MKRKTEKIVKNVAIGIGAGVSGASIGLGILLIIIGVILTMTIILAIIGIPLIILGLSMVTGGSVGAKAICKEGRREEDFERKKELLKLEHKLKSNKMYDWECSYCNKEFELEGKAKKEFDEEDQVEVICPYCNKTVMCELK